MPYKIYQEHDKYQVRKLEADGSQGEAIGDPHDTRSDAIKHLRALESNVMDASSFVSGAIHFEADLVNPRILHFKDYILARPETNKNKDNVDEQGIRELAETIAGMPIDLNHDFKSNIGFFTAGRVGSQDELRVDGSIWLDRCEENGVDPQEVLDGKYGMSIEADATSAECSVCRRVHFTESQYCEHIQVQGNDGGLRAKIKYGATRIMRGLRALGGAFTYRPAGSGTGMDSSSRIMFAAMEVKMNELTASEIAELWVNEMFAEIKRRKDVSDADKERAKEEYGDVQYADEKNKKYPLDKEHIHAAWSYINMPKNAAKYSSDELETIKARIKRAAKKFGMDISEDKESNKEKASMEDHDEVKETPVEEKQESAEVEKKEKEAGSEMHAEYETLKASLAELTANYEKATQEKAELESKLQTAETQLVEATSKVSSLEAQVASLNEELGVKANDLKAARVADLRAKLVGKVLSDEEFDAEVESLLAAPEKHIEFMLKNVQIEQPANPGRLNFAAQEQTTEEAWVVC